MAKREAFKCKETGLNSAQTKKKGTVDGKCSGKRCLDEVLAKWRDDWLGGHATG